MAPKSKKESAEDKRKKKIMVPEGEKEKSVVKNNVKPAPVGKGIKLTSYS